MTTATEFVKGGITGQTFRDISDKFGDSFNAITTTDPVMGNYALAFAWFREKEHLPVQPAYDKAMSLTTVQVEALFESANDSEVQAVADFVSPPPTTTP